MYAPSSPPVTADIHQLERWLREEYEQVRNSTDDIYSLAQFVLDNYVAAGYASIGQDVIQAYNITSTWQDFNLWDVELITESRGCQPNIPNGMTVFDSGLWQTNIKVSLEFAEAQQGRRIQMRFLNVTTNTPGATFNYAIGRNTDGVNLALSMLAQVDTEAIPGTVQIQANSDVRLQIRSDDVFTGVQAIGSIWDMHHVSEFRGDLEDIQIAG